KKTKKKIPAANPPRPPLFDRVMRPLTAHVGRARLGSLSAQRIRAAAKATGLDELDVRAVVTAHKLATSTGLSPDALFAIVRDHKLADRAALAARGRAELRTTVESAVRRHVVAPGALAAVGQAGPAAARLQATEASLARIVSAYKLALPASLLHKLDDAGVSTLADLRVAGATSPLARRLGVAADHKGLKTLVAQARLSFLGTDPATNARLIGRGFTNLMSVARAADAAAGGGLAPVLGFEERGRRQGPPK